MRLSCKTCLVLVAALTTACHETTAPPPAGSYILESINGQPVPANIQAEGGDTLTVIFSSLTLDALGTAHLSEHIRYVHPNSPPGEVTYTTSYSYRITSNVIAGQNIVFDYSPPCPPNALCAAPPTGMISGSGLILFYGETPQSRPPGVYRRLVD